MKEISLKDLIPVDYTDGSWPEDIDGILSMDYYKKVTEGASSYNYDDLYTYTERIDDRISYLEKYGNMYGRKIGALQTLKAAVYDTIRSAPDEALPMLDEALTLLQRMRRRAIMRKNKGKILLGRRRAQRRRATPDVIKRRALRGARNILAKKLLRKNKADASYAEKSRVEKVLKTRGAAIARIARKLIPQLRKKEMNKNRNKQKANE